MSNDSKPCKRDDAERNTCKGQIHGLMWHFKIMIEVQRIWEISTSYQNSSRLVSKTFTSFTWAMCDLILSNQSQ